MFHSIRSTHSVRAITFLRSCALGAFSVLSLAPVAQAATVDVGALPQTNPYVQTFARNGSFLDEFSFTTSTILDWAASFSPLNLDLGSTHILSISGSNLSLFNNTNLVTPIQSGASALHVSNLVSGNYTLRVSGVADGVSGGNYLMGLYSVQAAPVPEPAEWMLMGIGMMGLAIWRARRSA